MPNETAHALALEAEAEEYPEERGEILMEAAATWRRTGDDARARVLLEGLVADGGEDGCYARMELAAQLLDLATFMTPLQRARHFGMEEQIRRRLSDMRERRRDDRDRRPDRGGDRGGRDPDDREHDHDRL